MSRQTLKTMARTVVLVAVTALLLGSISAIAAEAKQTRPEYMGRPTLVEGEARGFFIFKVDGEWHLVWATQEAKHRFAGTVTTDGTFEGFARVGAEKSDVIKQTSPNTITIDAATAGGRDGVRFKLGPKAKTITFDLKYDGKPAPLKMIKIGPKKVRPAKNPVTFTDVVGK